MVFLSVTYCSNCSTVNFPIPCRAQKVPLETTKHTQYTHKKHQERATSQVASNKCSQASFCLRFQDKEQSCSHCTHATIWRQYLLIPQKNEKRKSWENASELCPSAKTSSTRFLLLMPQLIFGFPLHLPSQATLGTLQLKAGAATNRAVRHYSCCSKTLLSSLPYGQTELSPRLMTARCMKLQGRS